MPKKSLVLGLGGTGDWVLTFLKSRLHAAYGSEAVEKDVQFLLVDTIEPRVRQAALTRDGDNRIIVGVSGEQHEERVARLGKVHLATHEYLGMIGEAHGTAKNVLKGDARAQHLEWFPAGFYIDNLPSAALNISMGAGQWRQIGRLAMFLHSTEFVNRVHRLITQCGIQQNEQFMVYLVCSLGGGTGAGMFLDAPVLIRELMDKAFPGFRCWIISFLLLPGAFKDVWDTGGERRAVPRSYAAYRELHRFQTQAGRNVPFPIAYSSTHTGQIVQVTAKPYDTVFLVDAVKDLASAKPWAGVSPSIADAIEVFIDRTRGWRILENLINASARLAENIKINETLPAQFHSIGSHKIVLPARQYGQIFARQFVADFLRHVFPTLYSPGEKMAVGLERASVGDHTFEATSLEFMKGAQHLFMEVVDLLPGARRATSTFGDASMKFYRPLLLPKVQGTGPGATLAILEADPLERNDPEKAIEVTKKEEPTDAALRIVAECNRKLSEHWTRASAAMKAVADAVDAEMRAALEDRIRQLLNGEVEGFADHRVEAAIRLTARLSFDCDRVNQQVIAKARDKFVKQNGSDRWALTVAQARTAMEGRFTGLFKRQAAVKAQKAFIDAQAGFAEAKKIELVFDAFAEYTARLKAAADRINQQLTRLAGLATLQLQESAVAVAEADIATIHAELKDEGKSYTSSYGLSPYTGDESRVDVTMGGYQEVLYGRLTTALKEKWFSACEWGYQDHELRMTLRGIAKEEKLTRVQSGADLYRRLLQLVEADIVSQAESLSIFDYFLHQNISAQRVAEYFQQHTYPLIGPHHEAKPTKELYLLAKRPTKKEAGDFLNDLRACFGTVFTNDEKLQGNATDDFDNPYALTLLYLLQDLRDGQIDLLNQHVHSYQSALIDSESHVVNHIFRCEEEAGAIERAVGLASGMNGSEHTFFRLHPRTTRLLDRPGRVRMFAQLLALEVIRFAETADSGFVWMILPDQEKAGDRRVIWLTRKPASTEDKRVNTSLLLAMEQFCLAGVSANPQGRQAIEYSVLEQILQDRQRGLRATGGFPALMNVFTTFLERELTNKLGNHMRALMGHSAPFHTEEEIESLETILRYYLGQEVGALGNAALATT